VLGLGDDGRLVVAELKRDQAPDTVEMQAIKYAAMASRFIPDTLANYYAQFLNQRGEVVSDDDALTRLEEHAGVLDPDSLGRPRIVLVAGSGFRCAGLRTVWRRVAFDDDGSGASGNAYFQASLISSVCACRSMVTKPRLVALVRGHVTNLV
jgi:hypothetical protein